MSGGGAYGDIMTSESALLSRILIALGRDPRCFIFRNNTGCLPDYRGRAVRFGLIGSADILGCLRPSGRFLAIEVKAMNGYQSEAQKNFQRVITEAGGVYILARSVEDAIHGITTHTP